MSRRKMAQASEIKQPLLVTIGTDMTHNAAGFCDDPNCICQNSQQNLQAVDQFVQDGLASEHDAQLLKTGKTLW